jgi:hypothetical protein
LGIPGVFAVGEGFLHDAQMAVSDAGMPTMRCLEMPGYLWHQDVSEKAPLAEEYWDDLAAALTTPLTTEELNPEQPERSSFPSDIVVGENYLDAIEEYNKLMCSYHWSTGLPLIPPTRERVDWMLSGTTRSPDEVIGKVETVGGIATIEKLAINSVMAGAKPEYFPVIIAAMEALLDENYDSLHISASAGSFTLAIIVSGPIATEIGMNTGTGIWGYGYRPNATIGHAVRLSMINLGHLWLGQNDMASNGRTQAYTFFTFCENNEGSPWEPFHTLQGLNASDSSVTVSTITGAVGSYGGNTGEAIVQSMVNDVLSCGHAAFANFVAGTANPAAHPTKQLALLYPGKSKQIYEAGFTSLDQLRDYIYEQTRVPYEELTEAEITGIQGRIQVSKDESSIMADRLPPEVIELWEENLKPGGSIPSLVTKNDFSIFCVGTTEGYGSAVKFSYFRAPYNWTSQQTKKIYGATLTEAGK